MRVQSHPWQLPVGSANGEETAERCSVWTHLVPCLFLEIFFPTCMKRNTKQWWLISKSTAFIKFCMRLNAIFHLWSFYPLVWLPACTRELRFLLLVAGLSKCETESTLTPHTKFFSFFWLNTSSLSHFSSHKIRVCSYYAHCSQTNTVQCLQNLIWAWAGRHGIFYPLLRVTLAA